MNGGEGGGGENRKKQGEEKVEGQCDFYVY